MASPPWGGESGTAAPVDDGDAIFVTVSKPNSNKQKQFGWFFFWERFWFNLSNRRASGTLEFGRELFFVGLVWLLGKNVFQSWRTASHFLSSHLCSLRGTGEAVLAELRGSIFVFYKARKCQPHSAHLRQPCWGATPAHKKISLHGVRWGGAAGITIFPFLKTRWVKPAVAGQEGRHLCCGRSSVQSMEAACQSAWLVQKEKGWWRGWYPRGAKKGTAKDVFICVSGTFD